MATDHFETILQVRDDGFASSIDQHREALQRAMASKWLMGHTSALYSHWSWSEVITIHRDVGQQSYTDCPDPLVLYTLVSVLPY